MNHFTRLLQQLNDRIDLAQPAKSRIMLELSADMEDCFAVYLGRGMDKDEAMKLVREKFDLDDEVLDELVWLHKTPVKRWMDRITILSQTRLERIILVLVIIAIGMAAAKTMGNADFFRHASHFVLPMLGIGLYATVHGCRKIFSLHIKKDHDIRRLHSGILLPLVSSGAVLLIGVLGYFWELFKNGDWAVLLSAEQIFLLNAQGPASRHVLYYLVEWMTMQSATMMVCLLICSYLALIWYLLARSAAKIEQAEASYLLYL
ncbi:hypothetical protein KAR48_14635 [bacterium]|nr:hypothetical protein [bacterium]